MVCNKAVLEETASCEPQDCVVYLEDSIDCGASSVALCCVERALRALRIQEALREIDKVEIGALLARGGRRR